jgi:tryptophanyl-tRNA synthetase
VSRVFSGIQPTGDLHLGNLLGAVTNWVRSLERDDAIFCIVDLHALTIPKDPADLRTKTIQLTQLLIASGLDPERCTLFVQSHVREHSEMAWLMECTASYGELSRMTQFKEKRERAEFISAGLFTYPALQAADVLLYDTEKVPVGDDQRQHIELARDVAERFNARYGETFVVPEHAIPAAGARVMDLQQPDSKMSKSLESPQGTVLVLDDPKDVERKFKRAVTDSDGDVHYDPATKPGVSNLLSILAAATGRDIESVATEYSQYGPLKADAAEAVITLLGPIQDRYRELSSDPAETARLLGLGAAKARGIAGATMARARDAIGLVPPA